MSRDRDARVNGYICLLGGLALGYASLKPWISLQTFHVSIGAKIAKIFSIGGSLSLSSHVGGPHDGGGILLGGAVLIVLMALALMATKNFVAIVWRLGLLVCAGLGTALAIFIIADPTAAYAGLKWSDDDGSRESALRGLERVHAISISSTNAALWMAFGGALVVIGTLLPVRKPLREMPPAMQPPASLPRQVSMPDVAAPPVVVRQQAQETAEPWWTGPGPR